MSFKRQIAGIYSIRNTINGKYYVGSSNDIFLRWKKHKRKLVSNRHPNDYLQNAWNKYGEGAFVFNVEEEVEPIQTILHEVENRYLSIAKMEQDKCYNLCFEATGGELSEYSRKKISDFLLGKPKSLEHRRKLSEIASKRTMSMETRQKVSASLKKKVYSPEMRQKMRAGLMKFNAERTAKRLLKLASA